MRSDHPLTRCASGQAGAHDAHVTLAIGTDVPNRDLVLDGHFKSIQPQILAGRDKDGVGRFAAIIPSTAFGMNQETPRRVVILLDRSGSMSGEPISQARKAVEACLGVLTEADSFGLVAFGNTPEEFRPALQHATREARDQACKFLNRVDARGGTELVAGFLAAAKLLADSGGGGDILILTDGQVFGTDEILASARATGIRLHCLGIGSASQDRFLTLLARETGGVSRFVTPRERVDLSAVDLFASIGCPVATGLKTGVNIQPAPTPDVFHGTPILLFGEGDGPVELTWDGGRLNVPVTVNDEAFSTNSISETVWLLQGARLITDWESRYPSAEALAPLEKRKQNRVAMRLMELSRTYGLASREMSLVAVVKRAGDRPGDLPETRVVPVGVALDKLIQSASVPEVPLMSYTMPPPMPTASRAQPAGSSARFSGVIEPAMSALGAIFSPRQPSVQHQATTPDDTLLELAARMEADGGMPGSDPESRACATAVALLAFLSQGHTPSSGAFRSHVTRLVKFLKALGGLSTGHQQLIDAVIERAEKGKAQAGDWLKLAILPGDHWEEMRHRV